MSGSESDGGSDGAAPKSPWGRVSRRGFVKAAAMGVGVAATDLSVMSGLAFAASNPITTENALAGTVDWDLGVGYTGDTIEGYPSSYSVNAGEKIDFKINTVSTSYRIDIYRIGWYNGTG